MERRKSSKASLPAASKNKKKAKYVLKLYVAGVAKKSSRAIRSITEICDQYLEGRYSLEVIDIYKNPMLARGEQIIAAPTLIKELPAPLRKWMGDMADKEKVLLGLAVKRIKDEERAPKKKPDLAS